MKTALLFLGAVMFLTQEILTTEFDDFMLQKMKNITNTDAFCELVGAEDCEKAFEANVTEIIDEQGEKIVVSGDEQPSIALFDGCNPREQTIALPRHPDPDITVWPPCTRALRCGGCCSSDVFSCEPTITREKFLKVFDTRLPYRGAHRFKFLGVRIVRIIEHIHCDPKCKTKEHECHKYQKYNKRSCRCDCLKERTNLKSECRKNQIWDENECDCICPNRNTLVCPEPSYFSSATCKCTLKMGVSGEIDLDKLFEQLEKGLGSEIILNNQGTSSDNGTSVIAGQIFVEETENQDGSDDEDEKDEKDQKDKEEGKNENATSTAASASTTPTTTSTTTTTGTTTTTKTTTKTTPTPAATKPAARKTTLAPTTQNPCAHKKCIGIWKAKVDNSGNCRCMPPWK